MLEVILVLLIILWLTGALHINGFSLPNTVLFSLNGHPVTLINLLIFIVIVWAIGVLPRPFREIAGVLLVLWLLTLLGIIAITGLSHIIIIAIIVGIILSILNK